MEIVLSCIRGYKSLRSKPITWLNSCGIRRSSFSLWFRINSYLQVYPAEQHIELKRLHDRGGPGTEIRFNGVRSYHNAIRLVLPSIFSSYFTLSLYKSSYIDKVLFFLRFGCSDIGFVPTSYWFKKIFLNQK